MATSRLCSIPDCGKTVHARGLCDRHYRNWMNGSTVGLDGITPREKDRRCSIVGCKKPAHLNKSWCQAHYTRWLRHGDPLGGNTSQGEPLRFLSEVVLTYECDDCLRWPYATIRGYGNIHFEGKRHLVSRLVCERVHGPAPTPLHEAAHSCGNGDEGCVNKHHLSWKTPVENSADKDKHGTMVRGSDHKLAKLTEDNVRAIRSIGGNMKQREIAALYGVDQSTVSMILSRKKWGWLV